jgi:AcrR family transcriptional regulator
VQAVGVTRGPLYHQFRDKADLFAAAAEIIHAEIAERITAGARADGPVDPMIALHAGVRRFLEVCADPAVERILFLDAPAVLGWQAWRDMADRYGLGLLQQGIQAGIDAGAITPQPVVPLAHASPYTLHAPRTRQPPASNAPPSSNSYSTASHHALVSARRSRRPPGPNPQHALRGSGRRRRLQIRRRTSSMGSSTSTDPRHDLGRQVRRTG